MRYQYSLVTCFKRIENDETRIWRQNSKADSVEILRRCVARKMHFYTDGLKAINCMYAVRSDGAMLMLNSDTDEDWWKQWERDEVALQLKQIEADLLSNQVEAA